MMRTSFRLLLLALLGMSAVALADMHTFRIQRSGRDTAIQFDAYHLGKNYKARLVALEASGASATKLSAVATPQRPLVVAETFGAGRSSSEQGLVLVDGKAVSPFSFSYGGLDAVLCFRNGRVSITETEAFRTKAQRVGDSCDAALQVKRLIRGRASLVGPSRALAAPAVILALRGTDAWVLIFKDPVYLESAAALLARPAAKGGAGDFTDAVLLSQSRQPRVYHYGAQLIPGPDRGFTVAMTFDD